MAGLRGPGQVAATQCPAGVLFPDTVPAQVPSHRLGLASCQHRDGRLMESLALLLARGVEWLLSPAEAGDAAQDVTEGVLGRLSGRSASLREGSGHWSGSRRPDGEGTACPGRGWVLYEGPGHRGACPRGIDNLKRESVRGATVFLGHLPAVVSGRMQP